MVSELVSSLWGFERFSEEGGREGRKDVERSPRLDRGNVHMSYSLSGAGHIDEGNASTSPGKMVVRTWTGFVEGRDVGRWHSG